MNKHTCATISGGRMVVEMLKTEGVRDVFCVPGESYLPLLDALYDAGDDIRLITCRQEGGAANMADAYAKLSGRPGICIVTRGPGAANAAIGVHTAYQDSTPFILLVGQVSREQKDREAFQELDYRQTFGGLAKWVAEVGDTARIGEYMNRAFHVATSGRPGPVVLALPQDVLAACAPFTAPARFQPAIAWPGTDDMTTLLSRLAGAERPLVILGGSGWDSETCAAMRRFVENNDLPCAVSFRCQDYLDNQSPAYVGHVGIGIDPALAGAIAGADLIVAVGPRLGEMTTGGYRLLNVPSPAQGLIHVHAGAEELNSVYKADLAINAHPRAFARTVAEAQIAKNPERKSWRDRLRRQYEAFLAPVPCPGAVDLAAVFASLRDHLDEDAILTNGAGNYTSWLHRFHQYRTFGSQLAPTSGAMGYGVPAAIAAKLAAPKRQVVAVSGDGCFLMSGQELATAVHYRAAVVFLVVNNGMYGTIRMHQERDYPGRVIGTGLTNPDFAAYARAFGAEGTRVTETAEFIPALESALRADKPALIEIIADAEAIAPGRRLSGLAAYPGA